MGGAEADGLAVAGEDEFSGEGGCGGGEGDPDGADGFFGTAAVGAGDAGGGEGEVGFAELAGGFGHGSCDGLGDGAVFGDEGVADGEFFVLGGVGVGDPAAEEVGGGAGDVGEEGGEEAAGAGFGGGDGAVIGFKEVGDGGFEGGAAFAEDDGSEAGVDLLAGGVGERGGFGGGAGGVDADGDDAIVDGGADGEVGVGVVAARARSWRASPTARIRRGRRC